MNLYGLIVFHHVAVTGSVTKAAEALRISQPAVTNHVRHVGEELGLTLLAPKGRGILLTEAGQRVAEHAARLFALRQDIALDLANYRSGAAGNLRIAATSLPANFLLPGWLITYRNDYPDVQVTMETLNAQSAVQALLHYEADLALIGGTGESYQGLTSSLLLEDELWFVVSSNHRLAGQKANLAEIAEEFFVMREPGSAAGKRLFSLFEVNGVRSPRTSLCVNGVHETLHAVAAGFGVAFVSSLEAKPSEARGDIARVYIEGTILYNPISMLTREREPLPPPAHHFARQLEKICSAAGHRRIEGEMV